MKKLRKDCYIRLRINQQQKDSLEKMVTEIGKSKSDFVRIAITEYIQSNLPRT